MPGDATYPGFSAVVGLIHSPLVALSRLEYHVDSTTRLSITWMILVKDIAAYHSFPTDSFPWPEILYILPAVSRMRGSTEICRLIQKSIRRFDSIKSIN